MRREVETARKLRCTTHEYVNEKLRTLHTERIGRESSRPAAARKQGRFGGAVLLAAGRAFQRFGEGIERWARMEPGASGGYAVPNDLEPCTDC